MDKLYTVVTIFTDDKGAKLVHSYGPYTRNQADYRRRQWTLPENTAGLSENASLEVHVTAVLDPEGHSPFIWGRNPNR